MTLKDHPEFPGTNALTPTTEPTTPPFDRSDFWPEPAPEPEPEPWQHDHELPCAKAERCPPCPRKPFSGVQKRVHNSPSDKRAKAKAVAKRRKRKGYR